MWCIKIGWRNVGDGVLAEGSRTSLPGNLPNQAIPPVLPRPPNQLSVGECGALKLGGGVGRTGSRLRAPGHSCLGTYPARQNPHPPHTPNPGCGPLKLV